MAEGKSLVGVDIGSSSIKVCQLRVSRRGFGLVRMGYAPLPSQTIVDGHVMNAQAVAQGLTQAFAQGRIKQREIALSISGQAVIIRKITVPLMTAAELDEQIQWEAEQHIPFDIKDVHVDYEVLRRRPEAGQMDLMLVAAKRDELNDYVQIARSAKLKPVVVDIDAFSVQNLFGVSRGLPPDQTFAIINVGASLASINIISKGVSAFTRDIANGGNYITETIQRQLGVSFEQAEAFKCASSNVGADAYRTAANVPQQVASIIDGVCDTIAGEIQRSLDFYLATSGEPEMHRIYLTGGSSVLPALSAAIARRSRVPVDVLVPTERVQVEGKEVDAQLLQTRAAQMSVALGLALRTDRERRGEAGSPVIRVNLLPQKRAGRVAAASGAPSQRWLLAVLGVLVAELALFFGLYQLRVNARDEQLAKNKGVEAQINEINNVVKNHDDVKKQLAVLRAREEAINKLQAARAGPTEVFRELTRILAPVNGGPTINQDWLQEQKKKNPELDFNAGWDPRRLWLTSYDEHERTVKVEGLARDATDTAEFAARLRLSPYFYDLKILPGKKEVDAKTKLELDRFSIELKVRY